jgi:hypothetical protein
LGCNGDDVQIIVVTIVLSFHLAVLFLILSVVDVAVGIILAGS